MRKSEYEATVRALAKSRELATRSQKDAREYLIKLGVIDDKGNTKAEYRQTRAA